MYIEDLERIQEDSQREEQQRLPDLKSQTRVKNFIYIQDPESMQQINLKRSQGKEMNEANIGKIKLSGPNYMEKHQLKKE